VSKLGSGTPVPCVIEITHPPPALLIDLGKLRLKLIGGGLSEHAFLVSDRFRTRKLPALLHLLLPNGRAFLTTEVTVGDVLFGGIEDEQEACDRPVLVLLVELAEAIDDGPDFFDQWHPCYHYRYRTANTVSACREARKQRHPSIRNCGRFRAHAITSSRSHLRSCDLLPRTRFVFFWLRSKVSARKSFALLPSDYPDDGSRGSAADLLQRAVSERSIDDLCDRCVTRPECVAAKTDNLLI